MSDSQYLGDFERIKRTQEDIKNAEELLRIVGGIVLPEDRAEMHVKLTMVYQLLDYAKDENLFFSLASLFAGAMLGVLVNVATSDSPRLTKAGWVALFFSTIVTSIFVTLWRRAQQRSQRTQEQLTKQRFKRPEQSHQVAAEETKGGHH